MLLYIISNEVLLHSFLHILIQLKVLMNEEEMKTPYVKGERQKALKSEQKRQEKYGDNQH